MRRDPQGDVRANRVRLIHRTSQLPFPSQVGGARSGALRHHRLEQLLRFDEATPG